MTKINDTPTTIEHVKISQIVRYPDFQVRNSIKPANVKRYADLLKAGVKLAPVVLARCDGMLLLVDGWHRLAAMDQLEQSYTEAMIVDCSKQRAQWLAAEANLKHGVQLKTSEYRNVFKAYVSTRQHIVGKSRIKSYRDIGIEIGKPHTTIRNWMLKDFPEIAKRMGAEEPVGSGGLRAATAPQIEPATECLKSLNTLFQSSTDPEYRGTVILAVREMLSDMEASGGWRAPPPPTF